MNPTSWNFNPLLPTSNIINYDSSTEKYDTATQPYDGIPGVAATVATIIHSSGKFKMFLGLGFPLTSPSGAVSTVTKGGYAIYSQILWKNPTSYKSSLIAGATQQYYGGPSTVPLYAGPTSWFANANPANLAGQYKPQNNAYANVRPYDIATLAYDSSTVQYDGMNNDQSFNNWKTATAWTVTAGSEGF